MLKVGLELRQARIMAGLSLSTVAAAVGISASQISRIERGFVSMASVIWLARIGAVVGLDVRVRAYPGPDAVRDAAHIRVIERLRTHIHQHVTVRLEVPLPIVGDNRAWDVWLGALVDDVGQSRGIPVEVETRIADAQAQMRRITLKLRDAGEDALLLVVADTPANRRAVSVAGNLLSGLFPVSARKALAALARGRYPGGSSIIFV
jgi:transcriptional regulator with XRE-family HTH domain